jgi:hypothetical protein
LLDDLALFNRPLTETEVVALYTATGGVSDLLAQAFCETHNP